MQNNLLLTTGALLLFALFPSVVIGAPFDTIPPIQSDDWAADPHDQGISP